MTREEKNVKTTTTDEFMRWAMLNKWLISTRSRHDVTKKVINLFVLGEISREKKDAYLRLKKRDCRVQ